MPSAAQKDSLDVAISAEELSEITDSIRIDSLGVDSVSTLSLREQIDQLLETEMFKTSTVGIEIYDLTADTLVYAYNERQTLRPASTMKLMTAITALDKLGGSYRLSTSLRYKGFLMECVDSLGEKRANHLIGDVIIKGGMDPRFGADDMHAFVEAFQKQKIDTIYGSIIADLSFKDSDKYGHGWCWDDKNPTLTPLLWNKKDGFVDRFRQELRNANIVILPKTAMPRDSVFTFMVDSLKLLGVKETTLSVRHHSIDQILSRMMKESDNLFAECLFYQIAASSKQKNATAKHAATIMKSLVKKLGLDPERYFFADGSGLSLYNYQSAELQTKLLYYAYHNSNIYGHLLPSLPISGVDGTLRKRMTGSNTKGKVKAKTGTVEGVSSLAGYVKTESGNDLCFSIINQGIRHTSSGRNFQDKICRIMCNYTK